MNRPPASTGTTGVMPAASQTSMSSSPNAGARCTIPVPSSVETKSADQHDVRSAVPGEVAERRGVAQTGELGTGAAGEHLRLVAQLARVGGEPARRDDDLLARERAVATAAP